MSNLAPYVDRFFAELEMSSDADAEHNYRAFIHQAVSNFLTNENKENAYEVYQAFFDSYRISLPGESDPFIDLLDMLNAYEENAGTLIDKQRDHFIHSVNVFVSGLCIFTANSHYREAFAKAVLNEMENPGCYKTKNEEFFFRWGLASLFHDVGYPVEIVNHQINRYIHFVSDVDGSDIRMTARIEYDNFDELNSIIEVLPKRTFIQPYYDAYDNCANIDLLKPIDLLAHRIHLSLGIDLKTIRNALNNFASDMAKSGFIDHGFYSAVIILKWYGFMIQKCEYPPEQLYWPVLDSATSILLHNYYRNVLQKPPFSKGPMLPEENPIAFLLILCDEMQEWNREARGIITKKTTLADTVNLSVSDDRLEVTYVTYRGSLPASFAEEKEKLLRQLLAVDRLFPAGFVIEHTSFDVFIPLKEKIDQETAPRPLLKNLEMLAIAIHSNYNNLQKKLHPERPLTYPRFSDLPNDLKYSNLRQARSIYDRLQEAGLVLGPKGRPGAIKEFSPEMVEYFAIREHDDWVREREQNGWKLGPKNVEEKITPYLVPYEELSDEIQEYDREAMRNIPHYADLMGMAIYKV